MQTRTASPTKCAPSWSTRRRRFAGSSSMPDAITDIDFSAAQTVRDLLADLARQNVSVVFARVSSYLRSDMDRHCITPVIGEARIFTTLHEALAAVHSGVLREKVEL